MSTARAPGSRPAAAPARGRGVPSGRQGVARALLTGPRQGARPGCPDPAPRPRRRRRCVRRLRWSPGGRGARRTAGTKTGGKQGAARSNGLSTPRSAPPRRRRAGRWSASRPEGSINQDSPFKNNGSQLVTRVSQVDLRPRPPSPRTRAGSGRRRPIGPCRRSSQSTRDRLHCGLAPFRSDGRSPDDGAQRADEGTFRRIRPRRRPFPATADLGHVPPCSAGAGAGSVRKVRRSPARAPRPRPGRRRPRRFGFACREPLPRSLLWRRAL